MNTATQGEVVQTPLEGEINIYRAAALHAEFRQLLDKGEPLQFDLDAVEEIDTAGLQLLLAMQRTAQERGVALQFRGASTAVREYVALTRSDRLLGIETMQAQQEDDA